MRSTQRASVQLVAAICAAGVVAAQAPIERDSAGIRIVENRSRATAPIAFRLGAKTTDIGGEAADLDDEFNARRLGSFKGVRLSDGSLAVINAIRVQLYDTRGQRTGVFGRSGAGPQEFASLNAAEFCRTRGDTLVASDYRNGRIAIIYQRNVVRTMPLSGEFGGAMVGCFDDGTMLLQGGLPNFREPTYTIRLNRLRLNGTLANAIGNFELRSPSPVAGLIHPSVVVAGQRVYVGDGNSSEVRVYRADGRLVQIIRSADAVQRITQADVERALTRSSPAARNMWRPETFPAYARLLAAPDGRVWVRDFAFLASALVSDGWTAFDVDGRLIGRLEIPRTIGARSTSVLAFGMNEVQLTERDADGFYHLAFYPLIRDAR